MSPQPARLAQNRLPQGGLIDRTKPITFFFDGQALSGPCRRHARLGASRQRRASRGAQLQVSPPARHPRGRSGGSRGAGSHRFRSGDDGGQPACHRGGTVRRARSLPPELLALAAFRYRCRQRPDAPVSAGGFLLQDLHGAAGELDGLSNPSFRRAAGLGPAPSAPDPARYEHMNRHCEVLVIGSGPAGLAAAR